MTDLKTTPLHAAHVAAGARLVDFGGWEMPVQYEGAKAEHFAVRGAQNSERHWSTSHRSFFMGALAY